MWADWDAPYVTLDPAYEAAQLRVFGQMVLNGHIYRWVLAGVLGIVCSATQCRLCIGGRWHC